MEEKIKRPRGRPRVEVKSSVQLSIRLPRKYAEFLENVPTQDRENPGLGTKLRELIDELILLRAQVKAIKKILNKKGDWYGE